jgi:RNA polymerase sigma-32 factor
MLTEEEERELAMHFHKTGDLKAAHKLVTSHLRLVVKIAMGFKGYGLPMMDVISEGNIGLMHAVKKFDTTKGFRVSTYAMLWIKATIQDHIIKSWSLVKIGTSAARKKLFFNLKKVKNLLANYEGQALSNANIAEAAAKLGLTSKQVVEMDIRLSNSDKSLNDVIGQDEGATEMLEMLADDSSNQEEILAEKQELNARSKKLHEVLATFSERERDIINKRKLSDSPMTLEELADIYKVSRERIRQIEVRVIEKLTTAMTS